MKKYTYVYNCYLINKFSITKSAWKSVYSLCFIFSHDISVVNSNQPETTNNLYIKKTKKLTKQMKLIAIIIKWNDNRPRILSCKEIREATGKSDNRINDQRKKNKISLVITWFYYQSVQ